MTVVTLTCGCDLGVEDPAAWAVECPKHRTLESILHVHVDRTAA